MAPKLTGYFYRRESNRHIAVDDPDHQDAQLYFCWMSNGKRTAVCCHTSNLRTAERRIREFGGAIPIDDYDRFLKELVLIGKRADRKLNDRIDAKTLKRKHR